VDRKPAYRNKRKTAKGGPTQQRLWKIEQLEKRSLRCLKKRDEMPPINQDAINQSLPGR